MMDSFVFLEVPGSGQLMGWYEKVQRPLASRDRLCPEGIPTSDPLLTYMREIIGREAIMMDRRTDEGLQWSPWDQRYTTDIEKVLTSGFEIMFSEAESFHGRYTAAEETAQLFLWTLQGLLSCFTRPPRVIATWIDGTRVQDPKTGLWRGKAWIEVI